ncbi:MAG: TonB family protein [Burkholderiales bacterium]
MTTPVPVPIPQSEIASAQPTVPAREPEPGAGTVAERLPANGPDAGLLEKYRLALIDAARRYRRYPLQAVDRGWQGRVEIRLVIDANGTIRNATIKTSSRYAVLDDQALDMVKKGKSLARIPPALSGREFTVDVPVIFELQAG